MPHMSLMFWFITRRFIWISLTANCHVLSSSFIESAWILMKINGSSICSFWLVRSLQSITMVWQTVTFMQSHRVWTLVSSCFGALFRIDHDSQMAVFLSFKRQLPCTPIDFKLLIWLSFSVDLVLTVWRRGQTVKKRASLSGSQRVLWDD